MAADHNQFANLIWQIADLLRGPYPPKWSLNIGVLEGAEDSKGGAPRGRTPRANEDAARP